MNWCLCGNSRPSQSYKVAEADCNMTCPIDEQESCGGQWRMNVYELNLPQESQIINTFHSSFGWNGPSEKLVDGKGLDGKYRSG